MLYHYTSLSGMLGIIENQELWASDSRFLNDANEYRQILDSAVKVLNGYYIGDDYLSAFGRKCLDALYNMPLEACYIVSFSLQSDLLSQWRGYCPNGGVCIGFDKKPINKFCAEHEYLLSECIYSHEQQEKDIQSLVDECLDVFPKRSVSRKEYESLDSKSTVYADLEYMEMVEKGELSDFANKAVNELVVNLKELAPRAKNNGFCEEEEWRIIIRNSKQEVLFRACKSHLVPYVKVSMNEIMKQSIKKIIVGPNPESLKCIESITRLLEVCGLGSVEVVESKIPFRNW